MRVKNLTGTTKNKCHCDSWLSHWSEFSKKTRKRCAVKKCKNTPKVGGHVQKIDENDDHWYIIPICKKCNRKYGEELALSKKVKLVSANVSDTCGK